VRSAARGRGRLIVLAAQRDHLRVAVRQPVRDGLDQRGEKHVGVIIAMVPAGRPSEGRGMRKHPLVITVAIGLVIAVVGVVLLATGDDDSNDGVVPVDTAYNGGSEYLHRQPTRAARKAYFGDAARSDALEPPPPWLESDFIAGQDVNFSIIGAASRGLEQIIWKADRIVWKPDPADCVVPGSGAFADQNPFPATWLFSRSDCYSPFRVSVGLRNGDVFTEFAVLLPPEPRPLPGGWRFAIDTPICASGLRCTNRVVTNHPLVISTTLVCTDPNDCPLPNP
jgi:hypothetical protein